MTLRARAIIHACGAIERPLVFGDNDRPGVMLAGAVRGYLNRHAVAVGRNAVIATNNDSAWATALDLAARIAVNAPLSVQASKRIARGIADGAIASDAEFWEANKREGKVVMRSEDAREGLASFNEKRKPVWSGR